MTQKYEDMDRKRKQLMFLEYPYKADRQLWDSTQGLGGIETNKVFGSLQEIEEFKEEAAQNDISLTKRRDFVVGEQTTAHSKTISILDNVMSKFDEESYRNALEMADGELDLVKSVTEMYIIQAQRYAMGVAYEQEVGLGVNPETESCRQGLESILRLANDIIYGKKIDIHAEHRLALTDAIMNIDLAQDTEDCIDIDSYDYSMEEE